MNNRNKGTVKRSKDVGSVVVLKDGHSRGHQLASNLTAPLPSTERGNYILAALFDFLNEGENYTLAASLDLLSEREDDVLAASLNILTASGNSILDTHDTHDTHTAIIDSDTSRLCISTRSYINTTQRKRRK